MTQHRHLIARKHFDVSLLGWVDTQHFILRLAECGVK